MQLSRRKQLARFILAALFLISSSLFCWSAWQFMTGLGGRFLVEKSHVELMKAMDMLILTGTSQARVEQKLNQELETEPRDWILIESLKAISDQQNYTLSPDLIAKIEARDGEDHSMWKTAAACSRCVIDTAACELGPELFCGIAVNMTPIGDLAGIGRAGQAYLQGEDIDEIDLALSIVGFGSTALVVATGGSSSTVKAGAGLLKVAYLSGRIPLGIVRVLRKAAQDGIDWVKVPQVRAVEDLPAIVRMDALTPAIDAAATMGKIVGTAGPAQGFHLLSAANDIAELKKISRLTEVLDHRTSGYMAIIGKNRILRATMRFADEVYGMIVGFLGLLGSILGSVWSTLANWTIRRLRRFATGPV